MDLVFILMVAATAGGLLLFRFFVSIRRADSSFHDALEAAGAERIRTEGGATVHALLRGRPIHCVRLPADLSAPFRLEGWTPVPGGAPALTMSLRPQVAGDGGRVKRGEAIDVVVGDRVFDAAFLVEAAPADAAKAVLAYDVRASLKELAPCELEVDGERIVVRKRGGEPDGAEPAMVVRLLVEVADRLADAGGALERARLDALREGQTYRGPTAESTAEALGVREGASEISRLQDIFRRRRSRRRMRIALGLALLAVGLLLALAGRRLRRSAPAGQSPHALAGLVGGDRARARVAPVREDGGEFRAGAGRVPLGGEGLAERARRVLPGSVTPWEPSAPRSAAER